MTDEYCKCHYKHTEAIDTVKGTLKDHHEVIEKKLDSKWVFAGIGLFLFWMSFQLTMFNTMSEMKVDIAVIKNSLKSEHKRIQ